MPKPTRDELIVEAFWVEEVRAGYETALKLVADRFETTCAQIEKLVTADDELNAGNG